MNIKFVVPLVGALLLCSAVPSRAESKSVLNQTFEEWEREHSPAKSTASPSGGWICPVAGLTLIIGGLLLAVVLSEIQGKQQDADAARRKELDTRIVCPQCQERGFVTTAKVTEKAGIHGGKATAAILTGGVSLLATGLSNELGKTQATCSNCGSTWRF